MDYLKSSINKIKEIYKKIVDINIENSENFTDIIKEINVLENELFYINKLKNIDFFSMLKRFFKYLEKDPSKFFEFKYLLIEIFTNLDELYLAYITNNKNIIEKELKISNIIEILKNKYEESTNKKKYYYIKIILDKKIQYYYLSRRLILEKLKKYGKAYNYIPDILDDDKYDFFILDFKTENSINLFNLLENMKNEDEAILNYKIYEVLKNENIYNLKIYFDNELEQIESNKIIDKIEYKNMLDIYIRSKNQLEIIKLIKNIKDKNINLILYKNINNIESRLFIKNDINKMNIKKIDDIIIEILKDKKINDIIILSKYDYISIQYLEFLKNKYKIEYAKY